MRSRQPLRLEDQHEGRHFEHNLYPIPGPGGIITRATFSTRDVRERHGLEATLSSTVQFLRQILESSTTVAIISTDRQGRVLFWNTGAGNVLGFDADESVGQKTIEQLLPSDEASSQELMKVMMHVLGGGETVVQIMPFIHRRRRRTLHVTFSPARQRRCCPGHAVDRRHYGARTGPRETEQAERQLRLLAFTLNCARMPRHQRS
jgi:PAS domain S-box-containing protein